MSSNRRCIFISRHCSPTLYESVMSRMFSESIKSAILISGRSGMNHLGLNLSSIPGLPIASIRPVDMHDDRDGKYLRVQIPLLFCVLGSLLLIIRLYLGMQLLQVYTLFLFFFFFFFFFFFIRTSNFGAEAERSYIFLRFEAENVLKLHHTLHVFQ